MKKLIKNWSLITLSNVIYQVLLFVSFIRIARLLQPELFGKFTIIITAVSIGQIFSSLGLQKIMTREIARDSDKLSQISKLTFLPILSATIVSSIFLINYLFLFENVNDVFILIAGVVLLASISLWNYFEPIAFGIERMEISSYLNIISALVLFIIIFYLPTNVFTLSNILGFYVSIFLLRSIFYFIIEFRLGFFSKGNFGDALTSTTLLKKSMPFYGTLILSIPTQQLPLLFLGHFSSKEEVGYFGISNKFSLPLTLIVNNLLIAIYPMLSKYFIENKNAFLQRTEKVILIIVIIGIVFTLGLGLFSRELILIFLGDKYEPAIICFSIQVWISLNLIFHSFIATIFLASNKEKILVKLSIFNAVIIGIFSFIGSFYGSNGLAISIWLGLLLGLILHWYFVHNDLGLKIKLKLRNIFMFCFISLSLITFIVVDYPVVLRFLLFISVAFILITGFKFFLQSELKNLIRHWRLNVD